jgi:hypothetical protein
VQPRKARPPLITSTFAVVIAAVAALLLLGAVVFRHHQKPIASHTSRIGLNVEREGQVLVVAWDRTSQPVHNATHAILHINDGPQHSQTDLNSQQLRAANVKYWPETQKVTFMLEVYQGDGSISESVEVTGDAAAPAAVAVQPKRPSLAANASMEPARPSPFAVRIRREPSVRLATSALDPQPRLIITTAAMPPPSVAERPDQESRLGRVMGKIPFLRRLKKHPQRSENEDPLR